MKHTIPHDKCTQTRSRCCTEPFVHAHAAGPHSHNARCQECYSLQAIGLQQFAPCRSTLISHATKCTQNWNHAMHNNAIAHAVHEDSGRDRSGSRISAVSTAAREAEGASLAGVAGRASHCMCTTLCIETRTEILTGCIKVRGRGPSLFCLLRWGGRLTRAAFWRPTCWSRTSPPALGHKSCVVAALIARALSCSDFRLASHVSHSRTERALQLASQHVVAGAAVLVLPELSSSHAPHGAIVCG